MCLRNRRPAGVPLVFHLERNREPLIRERLPDFGNEGGCDHGVRPGQPRPLQKSSGTLLALAEAGAPEPGAGALGKRRAGVTPDVLDLCDLVYRAVHSAGDVVAHVYDGRWALLGREHRVEGSHAIGLRGRHLQPAADVVETALTNPANPGLQGVQRRQQHRAAVAGLAAAARNVPVYVAARPAFPAALADSQHAVDRRALVVGGRCRQEMQVHVRRLSPSRVRPTDRRRRAARSRRTLLSRCRRRCPRPSPPSATSARPRTACRYGSRWP